MLHTKTRGAGERPRQENFFFLSWLGGCPQERPPKGFYLVCGRRVSSERDHREAGAPRMKSGSVCRAQAGAPRMMSGSVGRAQAGAPRMMSGSVCRAQAGAPRMMSGSVCRAQAGAPRMRSGSVCRAQAGAPRMMSGSVCRAQAERMSLSGFTSAAISGAESPKGCERFSLGSPVFRVGRLRGAMRSRR